MSLSECPMCHGDGYKTGCEICGQFDRATQEERDRPKREAIENELARLEARAKALTDPPAPVAPDEASVEALADLLAKIRADRDGNTQPASYYRRWAEPDADTILAAGYLSPAEVEARVRAGKADAGEAIGAAIEGLRVDSPTTTEGRAHNAALVSAAAIARAGAE